MAVCANCGTENPSGHKFCGECGQPLASGCPSCGAENPPGQKFCGQCGAALQADAAPAPAATAPPPPAAPAAERRLVSVLFADLVGFTSLSESRDAEETRELLSRYFDTCRRLISLYGGTVEKFIGDAVMAVWGTPVATEDDAERAVRAALDLVAAVSALGDEVGLAELRARAAVMTGEAAVTIGAEGQGMVSGDLVNTASRVQSLAEPGGAMDWIREAVLTRSPATIPSPSAPMVTAASPVNTPARARSSGAPTSSPSAETAATRSSAARTARSGSSSVATGVPQTAMTASPMNFSTVPP